MAILLTAVKAWVIYGVTIMQKRPVNISYYYSYCILCSNHIQRSMKLLRIALVLIKSRCRPQTNRRWRNCTCNHLIWNKSLARLLYKKEAKLLSSTQSLKVSQTFCYPNSRQKTNFKALPTLCRSRKAPVLALMWLYRRLKLPSAGSMTTSPFQMRPSWGIKYFFCMYEKCMNNKMQ